MLSVNCSSVRPICLAFEERNGLFMKQSLRRFVCLVKSEKNSESQQQFEIDKAKAKEALEQLDQQLQHISQKPTPSPKIKASDVNLTTLTSREQVTLEEDFPEFSPPFLAYTAGALILFTISYNVFFYSVIKPAIDIPIERSTVAEERQIIE